MSHLLPRCRVWSARHRRHRGQHSRGGTAEPTSVGGAAGVVLLRGGPGPGSGSGSGDVCGGCHRSVWSNGRADRGGAIADRRSISQTDHSGSHSGSGRHRACSKVAGVCSVMPRLHHDPKIVSVTATATSAATATATAPTTTRRPPSLPLSTSTSPTNPPLPPTPPRQFTEHLEEHATDETATVGGTGSDNSVSSPHSPRTSLGILQSETVTVSAEGFDVAVDLMFPKVGRGWGGGWEGEEHLTQVGSLEWK